MRHIPKTSINMADGGKFGGKRRRELKEEKKYVYKKIMLIIIINTTSLRCLCFWLAKHVYQLDVQNN